MLRNIANVSTLTLVYNSVGKKNLSTQKKSSTFAPSFERILKIESRISKFKFHNSKLVLSYGVMVAHQILVLLVLVRIQVGQQKSPLFEGAFIL